ncbi:MAG: hypothetical protein WC462_02325 [archaeon]
MNKIKALDISELRIKLDQINEQIISGLKTRSKYPLNSNVFTEIFADNKTWFMYRLKKEQDLDSEYGRFLYNDQSPIIYSKKELAKSLVKAPAKKEGIPPVRIDFSKRIIEAYKKILVDLCEHTEDRATYGETTKQDVENILLYNERIIGVGEQVAGYKMQKNPNLIKLKDPEKIRKELVVVEREKEVINKTLAVAEKYELKNSSSVKKFLTELINITTDAEIQMILHANKV